MKCIAIHQPWAWAIASGVKSVENRNWKTHYRGRLGIHATKSLKEMNRGSTMLARLGVALPNTFVHGAVIAIVTLEDCLTSREYRKRFGRDPLAKGPYCWILGDAVAIEPVPVAGRQGLFEVQTLE